MGLIDSLLKSTRERRSLENPSSSLDDPELWEAYGAVESASGQKISAESALKFAPWWRGINLISRDVAKLPLVVYKRAGQGKEKDSTHPAYRLLRYRANDELMSASTFKQTIQALAMSTGNGYAWIRRNQHAVPLELIIIDPCDVVPFRENGRLWYGIKIGESWRRTSPADVFHIKGLSRDGLVGYSVYRNARDSLGEGVSAQKYESRFFKNDARPSVVIEVPGAMPEDAQREFIRQWENTFGGLENSHRTAIVTHGGKVNPFSRSARDSQLLELRKFNLVDIANWCGVPVHKVGGEGRTAFASLEQENQAYLDESLDPWLVTWEDEAREKLLTEEEKNRDTHVIEFTRQALVRADIAARYTAYNTAIRGGWMNADMALAMENQNPIAGGLGQSFLRAKELAVVGQELDDLPTAMSVTEAVVSGRMPPETAKAMLKATFPLLSDKQINEIIDPLEDFEPPPPPPSPFTQPQLVATEQPTDEPAEEPAGDPATPLEDVARRLVMDAARRACRHLRIQAVRRAKLAGNFLNMIDDDRPTDEAKVGELVADVVSLCGGLYESEQTAAEVSRCIFDEAKTVLLAAADAAHNRDELAECVESRMNELEVSLPVKVANLLLKGSTNGTTLSA